MILLRYPPRRDDPATKESKILEKWHTKLVRYLWINRKTIVESDNDCKEVLSVKLIPSADRGTKLCVTEQRFLTANLAAPSHFHQPTINQHHTTSNFFPHSAIRTDVLQVSDSALSSTVHQPRRCYCLCCILYTWNMIVSTLHTGLGHCNGSYAGSSCCFCCSRIDMGLCYLLSSWMLLCSHEQCELLFAKAIL